MLDTQYVLWSFYRSLSHAYMHTRAHAHRHSLAGWINPCFQAPLSGWPVVLWFCHAAPLLFYSNDHASASFFFSLNFKGRRLELIHKWSVKWTPDTWSIGRKIFFRKVYEREMDGRIWSSENAVELMDIWSDDDNDNNDDEEGLSHELKSADGSVCIFTLMINRKDFQYYDDTRVHVNSFRLVYHDTNAKKL